MDERRSVSVLWAVLAVLLGIFSGYQVYADSERSECQARFNVAFSEQVRIRSDISARADQAQSALLLGVSRLISLPPTQDHKVQLARAAEFRELFKTFDAAVDRVEKARADNPLPELPSCAGA